MSRTRQITGLVLGALLCLLSFPLLADPALLQARLEVGPLPAAPNEGSGSDQFGYTYESVPLAWIDASGGTATGIDSDTSTSGAIDLGFSFKFYENRYNQLYVSRYGYVTFDARGARSQSRIPDPSRPNNVIAPYWTPADSAQYVRYLRGGSAPNRWFVVEWHELTSEIASGMVNTYTFELKLEENGNALFQYQTMQPVHSAACQASGIEDSTGLDGLPTSPYCHPIASNQAVLIRRPPPAARVRILPNNFGEFTDPGGKLRLTVPLHNTGELGPDTFEVQVSSPWTVTLYSQDGSLLTDSDGDGAVDTGAVAQGAATELDVVVTAPDDAQVGDGATTALTVRSSIDTTVSRVGIVQSAIPAPFAQAYDDNRTDGAMALHLMQPAGQAVRYAAAERPDRRTPALVETATGNFAYVWSTLRCERWAPNPPTRCESYVEELEYTLLDRYGDRLRPVARLTHHRGAVLERYDNSPAVAAAPNGKVAVAWQRYLWNPKTEQYNYNVYFALLDETGAVVAGPTNVTNNPLWGNADTLDIPRFESIQVTATDDDRFVLAWARQLEQAPGDGCSSACYVDDIYYAVQNAQGSTLRAPTPLTHDSPGADGGYTAPGLSAAADNRALLMFGNSGDDDIYYAALDSAGNLVRPVTNLVGDGTATFDSRPDAARLANGNTLVAWQGGSDPSYELRYALLDDALNRIAGPTTLPNPLDLFGNEGVSVTTDGAGHAILTWSDRSTSYRRNLYYALLNSDGAVRTAPMIFHSDSSSSPHVETNREGYANTSYSWQPPTDVDGVVQTRTTPSGGRPGSAALIPLRVANYGATEARNVVLTATLPAELTYLSDTSGVTPTIVENTVRWELPSLSLLERHDFSLAVAVSAGAAYGTRHTVTLSLASDGPEANPADNTSTATVVASHQLYLPLTLAP